MALRAVDVLIDGYLTVPGFAGVGIVAAATVQQSVIVRPRSGVWVDVAA